MRGKIYRVHLTEDERQRLLDIVAKGVYLAWQIGRNEKRNLVKWQFTAEDARRKLHGLYPVL
jgi:hypothetical protein